ncbi:hypothetical protein GW932_02855 [archaeon]|nr:hypothetical protein [archaeon]
MINIELFFILTIINTISLVVMIFLIKREHIRRNYDDFKSHRLMKMNTKYLVFMMLVNETFAGIILYILN